MHWFNCSYSLLVPYRENHLSVTLRRVTASSYSVSKLTNYVPLRAVISHWKGWPEANTLDLYSRSAQFESQPGYQLSWLIFCHFSWSLQTNDRIVPLPFKYFPVRHTSAILLSQYWKHCQITHIQGKDPVLHQILCPVWTYREIPVMGAVNSVNGVYKHRYTYLPDCGLVGCDTSWIPLFWGNVCLRLQGWSRIMLWLNYLGELQQRRPLTSIEGRGEDLVWHGLLPHLTH